MPEDFVIARNPDADSRLPYLVRIPLGGGLLVKARETWPRTQAVYCHPAEDWPDAPAIVERVPVRFCGRRGAAIDLVLDRARENRSQFVFTVARGREVIFWQTARVVRKARPAVRTPTARSAGAEDLCVLVDDQEKYPYRFAGLHVQTERRRLPAGDYAVELDGQIVCAIERKTLVDLISSLSRGRLGFVVTELATLPRAAVVVEDRYSGLFKQMNVRGSVVAEALAELQVRWPAVPVVFCETRPLAEQWAYRFLAAARAEIGGLAETARRELELPLAPALMPRPPTAAEIRQWALGTGLPVSARGGRLPREVLEAFEAAHGVTLGN